VVVAVRRWVVVVRGACVVGAGAAVVGAVVSGGAVVVVVVASVVVVVLSAGAAPGVDVGGADVTGEGCSGASVAELLLPVSEKAAARNTVPETRRMDAQTVVSARLLVDLALSPPPKGF
jgi:hypothetical protein